jgi:hypothetical protein
MYGKPIRAFPEQDHEAHIAVHMQFMQDPSLGGNPAAQKTMAPILIAHIAEHIALLYRQRMEASVNIELPPLPNFKDPKFRFNDVDPEMDMLISQRAAQVVQQAPQMKQIEALKGMKGMGQGQNPLQYAQQLAKLETDALKARTQAQIQADQAKAKSNIEIKQAEARQDLEIEAAKAQADMEAKIRKLEAELQLEREKNAAELQMEMIKNDPTV